MQVLTTNTDISRDVLLIMSGTKNAFEAGAPVVFVFINFPKGRYLFLWFVTKK